MKYRISVQTIDGVAGYIAAISDDGETWRYIIGAGTLQETDNIGTATRFSSADDARGYAQKFYARLPSALETVEEGDLGK